MTPRKFFSSPMGIWTGTACRPKNCRMDLDGPVEVGVLAVHLVDDEDPGQAELLEHLPDLFRSDLDAGHAVDEDGRRVHGPQAGLGVPEEIAVPGRIDDVDLVVFPFDEAHRRADRDLALDLLGLEVRHGVALVHLGQAAGRPARRKESPR